LSFFFLAQMIEGWALWLFYFGTDRALFLSPFQLLSYELQYAWALTLWRAAKDSWTCSLHNDSYVVLHMLFAAVTLKYNFSKSIYYCNYIYIAIDTSAIIMQNRMPWQVTYLFEMWSTLEQNLKHKSWSLSALDLDGLSTCLGDVTTTMKCRKSNFIKMLFNSDKENYRENF